MIKEKIQEDMKTALKGKKEIELSTLRMLLSSIHNKEIENKTELKDEEILEVIAKEIKRRKESVEEYKKGQRLELAEREEDEVKILEKYLPEQLSSSDLTKIIEETILEVKAEGPSDFGKVMGSIMPKIKGRADGFEVSKLTKEILEKK